MMVGPQHPRARASSTLRALIPLLDFHAITPDEARTLRDGYLFLRVLEHRLQLLDDRAVRTLPESEKERSAIARRMGSRWRNGAAARWLNEEHSRHRRAIRALCEHMFWGWRDTTEGTEDGERPHGPEVDGSSSGSAKEGELPSVSPASAMTVQLSADSRRRLQRMAEGTPNHPLPAPLARQIAAALPDALQELDGATDPERAVANLERLCEASGNRLSLLRSLSAAPAMSRGVFTILGGSEFLTDTLIRVPELLDLAAQRPLLAQPKGPEQARADCRSYCLTFRDRAAALRRWKAREMLRIGLRDLVLNADPHEITAEIAHLAGSCLALACEEVGAKLRPGSDRIQFCVLGMGKFGGAEMHYSSDADVIFSYQTPATFDQAPNIARTWAEELMRFMGERTEDGIAFELDPRLRPEGRNGALAPSVQGYIEYFENPTHGIAIWERQALTRARYVAGDAETAARLRSAIRHVAYPDEWQPGWSEELRHIKSRVENERAARGAASGDVYDVKLGPGTLNDIEFSAQWLALRHGAKYPALQTTHTIGQIDAAAEAGVLPAADAAVLRDAYTFLRRAELRLQITQEQAVHGVKHNSKEFAAWARSVFPDAQRDEATARFEAEWQQHTSAARKVMERVRDSL
jgi:glutamate-ammonia-ligase adenylyltransferase